MTDIQTEEIVQDTPLVINKKNNRVGKIMNVGVVSLGCDKNRVDSEIMLSYYTDLIIKKMEN